MSVDIDLLFATAVFCAGYYVYSVIKRSSNAQVIARLAELDNRAARMATREEELARGLRVVESTLIAKDAEIERLKNSLIKSRQELTGARQRFERKLNKLNTRRARRL